MAAKRSQIRWWKSIYYTLYKELLAEEVAKIKIQIDEDKKSNKLQLATSFDELVVSDEFEEFLTLPAYKYI
jgi:malate synthase